MRPICKISRRAALLTCVTNWNGIGPGHSAVVVDDHVYTFEQVGGAWLVPGQSGWRQIRTVDYLALKLNTERPVVVQELDPARTDATAIHTCITVSDGRDADYGGSGVCSHLAARAISAGLGSNINPVGLNTPAAIYTVVKNSGSVSASYYTFPGAGDGTNLDAAKKRAMAALYLAFRQEWSKRREPPGVSTWR